MVEHHLPVPLDVDSTAPNGNLSTARAALAVLARVAAGAAARFCHERNPCTSDGVALMTPPFGCASRTSHDRQVRRHRDGVALDDLCRRRRQAAASATPSLPTRVARTTSMPRDLISLVSPRYGRGAVLYEDAAAQENAGEYVQLDLQAIR